MTPEQHTKMGDQTLLIHVRQFIGMTICTMMRQEPQNVMRARCGCPLSAGMVNDKDTRIPWNSAPTGGEKAKNKMAKGQLDHCLFHKKKKTPNHTTLRQGGTNSQDTIEEFACFG